MKGEEHSYLGCSCVCNEKKWRLIKRYLYEERIDEYQKILECAKEQKYQCISLRMFAEGKYDCDKNVLIIRHDIDHVSHGTNLMFETEKKYGAYSSFYFRDSKYGKITADKDLMREIEEYGSEAYLHFETISNYIKSNKSISRNQLLEKENIDQCIKLLKSELVDFRNKYEVSGKTIASHGTRINGHIGISNNYLTENTEIYSGLNIVLEAYNKEFVDQLGTYISDSPIEYNQGYRYGITPIEAMEQGISPILFLSHPNHWYYNWFGKLIKIFKIVVLGAHEKKDKFTRIAP